MVTVRLLTRDVIDSCVPSSGISHIFFLSRCDNQTMNVADCEEIIMNLKCVRCCGKVRSSISALIALIPDRENFH